MTEGVPGGPETTGLFPGLEGNSPLFFFLGQAGLNPGSVGIDPGQVDFPDVEMFRRKGKIRRRQEGEVLGQNGLHRLRKGYHGSQVGEKTNCLID
jgi:hypothetical protein